MALPRVDIPIYTLTLPSSKKEIKYRPFVVKEEKILLLALEEQDPIRILDAIEQIINNCTFGKLKIDDMAQIDIEYLFVSIRNKSMGEGVEVEAECKSCHNKNNLTLDLSHIKVDMGKAVKPEIQISEDMWVIVKYPSIRETYKMALDSSNDTIMRVLASSITTIIKGQESYNTKDSTLEEVISFLEDLTQTQLDTINAFFEAAPRLIYENSFDCVHCKAPNIIKLEGLQNFFD
jgi:hypothetical protein